MTDDPKKFISEISNKEILELFEHVPGLYFWLKNKDGQYMANNQAGVHRKAGQLKENEIIGKSDYDFFPKEMADAFYLDDETVIVSGKKMVDRVELIINQDGTVSWHCTTKIPLFNYKKDVIGTAGITRKLESYSKSFGIYEEMGEVIKYMQKNFCNQIAIKELAKIANLSVSQFERKFKKYFKTTPLKFLISMRIKSACHKLVTTKDRIEAIAIHLGFSNPGAFTSTFKAQIGMLPTEYRQKFFKGRE